MNFNSQSQPLDLVQAKRILRQVAVMSDRYGLGEEAIELLKKAIDAGFYDDNTLSGLVFCLANNQKADEAVKLYGEAEQVLGGAERAPSTYVAAIYANMKDRRQSQASQMLKHFERTCVPHLNDDVRPNYVEFLELIKEQL